MTDEKRLDDEPLENVSGGLNEPLNVNALYEFESRNCYCCSHNEVDCPHGGAIRCFRELGCDPYAKCPEKEA